MPRYNWMSELVGDIIDNVGEVFEYAKKNMRTTKNYNTIKEITELLKKEF